MRASDLLLDFGRPVAYFPGLVKRLGSVNAVIFFSQIFYWQDKADSKLGVYKTSEEIESETGLSYREQLTARKHLVSRGILVETNKRLEHKIYYLIDCEKLDYVMSQPIENAPNAQSATGESHNSDFAEQQNERPRQDKIDGGDETNPQFDPTEITTYITTDITDGTSGKPDDQKSSSKIKLNYENIINSYHDILSDMPAIKVMTDERKRKLRNFWIKFKFNQERWENYLSYIASNCRWMMEDRDNGRGGTWRRKNLDYLITERCYVAVKEERANDK
ncbi:replication protein [Proteus mirabilis]|uniref:replication protein n=1 Tax=Proteus mirabilis TaxID=584 RepID=UPI001261F7EE|nr:replication protein [Proteus mirabilis]KAB7722060.1 replication protein [Proteus mirabilis]MBG6043871.1 replication protein [Proteus mirabilis]MBI6272228.1 replication protein [Proteus mirabilis]MCZ5107793.1 replication protein [Proteus mirabilis]MDL2105121.1 replication protein [Proteus mirabilis]